MLREYKKGDISLDLSKIIQTIEFVNQFFQTNVRDHREITLNCGSLRLLVLEIMITELKKHPHFRKPTF